jgi:hypothetical protein
MNRYRFYLVSAANGAVWVKARTDNEAYRKAQKKGLDRIRGHIGPFKYLANS